MNTNEITTHANDISLKHVDKSSELCTLWPHAKQALTLLKDLIKNPIVKVSIGAIIVAGDAIIGRVCGERG